VFDNFGEAREDIFWTHAQGFSSRRGDFLAGSLSAAALFCLITIWSQGVIGLSHGRSDEINLVATR
jgi:hypothetical protein